MTKYTDEELKKIDEPSYWETLKGKALEEIRLCIEAINVFRSKINWSLAETFSQEDQFHYLNECGILRLQIQTALLSVKEDILVDAPDRIDRGDGSTISFVDKFLNDYYVGLIELSKTIEKKEPQETLQKKPFPSWDDLLIDHCKGFKHPEHFTSGTEFLEIAHNLGSSRESILNFFPKRSFLFPKEIAPRAQNEELNPPVSVTKPLEIVLDFSKKILHIQGSEIIDLGPAQLSFLYILNEHLNEKLKYPQIQNLLDGCPAPLIRPEAHGFNALFETHLESPWLMHVIERTEEPNSVYFRLKEGIQIKGIDPNRIKTK